MPYKIKKVKSGFKVCLKSNPSKCFSKKPLTSKKAKAQLAAIGMHTHESVINFEELVEEALLLLENPDEAFMNTLPPEYRILKVGSGDDRPFVVGDIRIMGEKSPRRVLAISLSDSQYHSQLTTDIELYRPDGMYELYPKEHEKAIRDSFKRFPPDIENGARFGIVEGDFFTKHELAGRMWIHRPDVFCIALWTGEPSSFKKWLLPILPKWNPDNKQVYVQIPHAKNDEWITLEEFMERGDSNTTPEIEKLREQIYKLIPELHNSSGFAKIKLESKVKDLQKQIRELQKAAGLQVDPIEDKASLKGSLKDAVRAGDQTVAQMRASQMTSESINNLD